MDNNNKISFIPKKALIRSDLTGKQPVSLFLTLSFSTLLITCAIYGGAYIYVQTLEKGIDIKRKELQDLRNNFDLSIIDKARDLKARLKSAQELVDRHIALSSIFDYLGQVTLRSVGYNSFQYINKDSKLDVSLGGMAPSYASVALQKDSFSLETGNQGHLTSFSMGDYKLDENGNVSFTLKASLNSALFLYKNSQDVASQETPATSEKAAEAILGTSTSPTNQ